MALERQADLDDAPAQQDEANRTDEAKDEVAQIVHDPDGIVCRECGYGHHGHHGNYHDDGAVEAEAPAHLSGDFVLLKVVFLHAVFPPFRFQHRDLPRRAAHIRRPLGA